MEWSRRLVRAAARWPGRTLVVCALVAAIGGVLALRLEPSAATDTLVGKSTATFKATEDLHAKFGDDAIFVLVRGPVQNIVYGDNFPKLTSLEGCLSGNKPAQAQVPGGAGSPCDVLARTKPVDVVFGPGTFINSAVTEIQTQIQQTIQRIQSLPADQQGAELTKAYQLATQYGIDPTAIAQDPSQLIGPIVFDSTKAPNTPKQRFAYLFPNKNAALVTVRLKPTLNDTQRENAIREIRAAVKMPQFAPTAGVSYLVSGAPIVVNDVTKDITDSLIGLLIGGVLMMGVVLPLVFRGRARMLPLVVALGAAGVVFGLMSLFGARLTLASIAVLPVLLGLGVDYAIQYQARVQEDGLRDATTFAMPTIGTACLATVAGFAVLLLSPVPMVRGFGLVLMAGVILAFVFALSAGTAALVALARLPRSQTRFAASVRGATDLLAVLTRPLATAGRGAGQIARRLARPLRSRSGRGVAARVTAFGVRRPAVVLGVGAALAVAGLAVDSQTDVVSDIQQLVPRDTPAIQDLLTLQDKTHIAGEIDVLVEADDLTNPTVLNWMRGYQARLAKDFKYSTTNGCGAADLCPAFSLPDLFRTDASSADETRVKALLDAVPSYFSRAVITPDRKAASMAFGIKLLSFDRQQQVIETMRRELNPPPGVHASVAGLPVLASEANDKLSDPGRRLLTIGAGLAVVALALLLVYRRWERAWVPLVPIAMATGWSALVLWLTGIPLNPMSATLGALVIAISTEFSVLLVARYREEREYGGIAEALEYTYATTGRAVLASGVTAIAGFAVLAFSDVRMLKDFGRVTVVDLTVSLLGVLAVLPAVLAVRERRTSRRRVQQAA